MDLSWCFNIDSEPMSQFITQFSSLRCLRLQSTSIDTNFIKALCSSCPLLLELIIPRCSQIDDESIYYLSELYHLQYLDISWTLVEDRGMLAVLNNCVELLILILEGCKDLSNAVLDRFLNGDAPKLTMLGLGWVNLCSKEYAKMLSEKRYGLYVSGL